MGADAAAQRRIARTFAACGAEGRAALVGYLTAGDPDLAGARERLLAACEAGLDVLEVGVPFSDPTADGPDVQAAMVRALEAGTRLHDALELVAAVRARFALPIVLFSYANPLLRPGAARTCGDAAAAGADALLVVDMPPEAADGLRAPAQAAGLDWIGLVAPTTTPGRLQRIADATTGFVYAVSLKGVTGAALAANEDDLRAQIQGIRGVTDAPIAVGFGVRTPEQARSIGQLADGVVVGSALIRAAREGIAPLRGLVQGLRRALDPVAPA